MEKSTAEILSSEVERRVQARIPDLQRQALLEAYLDMVFGKFELFPRELAYIKDDKGQTWYPELFIQLGSIKFNEHIYLVYDGSRTYDTEIYGSNGSHKGLQTVSLVKLEDWQIFRLGDQIEPITAMPTYHIDIPRNRVLITYTTNSPDGSRDTRWYTYSGYNASAALRFFNQSLKCLSLEPSTTLEDALLYAHQEKEPYTLVGAGETLDRYWRGDAALSLSAADQEKLRY